MMQNTLSDIPITVYQMGKVGSETIINSLKQLNLGTPIYHVHILAHKNINVAFDNYQNKHQPLTLQLEHSKILRDYLDNNANPSLNVITSVREPISQFISAFFQNIESSNLDFIDNQGNLRQKYIHQYLTNRLSNYNINNAWNCNWFDNDFNPALELDVYQHEFNIEMGYAEFSCQNFRILILQLENSKFWGNIITDFLGLSNPMQIIKTNMAKEKKYNQVYKYILDNIKIPTATLEKVYQCKYCQHFYSEEAIENFVNKWSK